MNRWLVSGVWLAAVMALVSASTQGAIGIAAMWALPAALAATMAGLGWPDKPMSRVVGGIAIVWELALIGAYWPFASKDSGPSVTGPMTWPTHSLVILAVLAALALVFVAMFVLPALGLNKKIKLATGATAAAAGPADELVERVGLVLADDGSLAPLWREYLAHLRGAGTGDGNSNNDSNSDGAQVNGVEQSSAVSARAVFDVVTVTHSRLRLDLFRNLPGIFTGIGIIGTFGGLIMGLRTFRISQDPQVVQKSLELLMGGVWEAFLISAVAITLAITVTLIEKIVMSLVVRRLDGFATALDNIYPPRPQAESEAWMPMLINALKAFAQAAPTASAATAVQPLSGPALPTAQAQGLTAAMTPTTTPTTTPMMTPMMVPMSLNPEALLAGRANSESIRRPSDASSALLSIGEQTRDAMTAMSELARSLPVALTDLARTSNQSQLQSVQAMKMLSGRLEGVASGIETAGRKTLETVASRMMQSESNMVARHHLVAEHLGELVQRIETLCGLMQRDRGDDSQQGAFGFEAPGYEAAGFDAQPRYADTHRAQSGLEPLRRPREMARQPMVEFEDGNQYDDGEYPARRESESRYERGGETGSFGS